MAKKKADSDKVIIKRYGNRRLYNTETSSYVNYQDLIKLIRDGNDIQVIDSRTKADVTKSVLMQVILEEEKNQKNLLPLPFLFQLIRAREEAAQDGIALAQGSARLRRRQRRQAQGRLPARVAAGRRPILRQFERDARARRNRARDR